MDILDLSFDQYKDWYFEKYGFDPTRDDYEAAKYFEQLKIDNAEVNYNSDRNTNPDRNFISL